MTERLTRYIGVSQVAQWVRIRLQSRRLRRCGFAPWIMTIPGRRAWQPTPAFLPGKSHGQRSLAGYRPSVAESDTTEWLGTHMHHSSYCTLLNMQPCKYFNSLNSHNYHEPHLTEEEDEAKRGYPVQNQSWKVAELGLVPSEKLLNGQIPHLSGWIRISENGSQQPVMEQGFQTSGQRRPPLSHFASPGTLFLKETQNSISCWETVLRRGGGEDSHFNFVTYWTQMV